MDVTKSPYAGFLEDVIEAIMEYQPVKIGICALNPDDTTMTGYYGDCGHVDKAVMAHHIYCDSVMEVVKSNAKMILEAAEEEEDEG